MVFSSPLFLFIFFPAVLCAYYLIKLASPFTNRAVNSWLLIASLVFYLWGAPKSAYLVALTASVLFDFWVAIAIWHWRQKPGGTVPKLLLAASVTQNVALLAYYKYADFFVRDVIGSFASWPSWTDIALPIGISFIAFHKISYTVDIYFGKVAPKRNLGDYGLYLLFFPQLIAGPIVRYHTIAAQIDKRQHTIDLVFDGLWRFSRGLAKKVLIANQLGLVADQVFSQQPESLSATVAWIGILLYSFQIYFDFSGYSDMAIGLGRMFGFHLPENFNQPYTSRSITEFWRRWHISLSLFFRDYVYIPLGGNRQSLHRTLLNLWIVFLLCGLWHGAKMNFVVWGAYFGFWLTVERLFLGSALERAPRLLATAYAFTVVTVGWVFFRADNLGHAAEYIQQMFLAGTHAGEKYDLVVDYHMYPKLLICLSIAAAVSFIPIDALRKLKITASENSAVRVKAIGSLALITYSLVTLSTQTFNPFLYFNF